jgi:hypothetical protein
MKTGPFLTKKLPEDDEMTAGEDAFKQEPKNAREMNQMLLKALERTLDKIMGPASKAVLRETGSELSNVLFPSLQTAEDPEEISRILEKIFTLTKIFGIFKTEKIEIERNSVNIRAVLQGCPIEGTNEFSFYCNICLKLMESTTKRISSRKVEVSQLNFDNNSKRCLLNIAIKK